MRTLLATLAALVALIPSAASQCRGTTLGVARSFAGYAVSADRVAAATFDISGLIQQVTIHELQPDGSIAQIDVAEGFDPIPLFARSMTFDGERIQIIGSTPVLYELDRDASGQWQRYDLPLSATLMRHGQLLATDEGRWAALGLRDVRTLTVDVIERNAAGRLEVVFSLELDTRRASGHDVISGIDLDGDRIVVRSGAERRGAAQIVERQVDGTWRRAGFLVQPPGSEGYYSGVVAVEGDVAATVRRVRAGSGEQHAVHVYERDSQSPVGWTLRQQITLPRSVFAPGLFRYIASVDLVDDRLIVSAVNRGTTQVLRRAPSSPLRYEPETTLDGIGNDVFASDSLLVGTSLDGETTVLTSTELSGLSRATVCVRAGEPDCVDGAHLLVLDLWVRRLAAAQTALVARVPDGGLATGVALVGSPQFAPQTLSNGMFCVGPDARRSTLFMVPDGLRSFEVSVPLTNLPAAGGSVSAVDGETWWFQAATTTGAPRELSSAVRVLIRL